MIGFSGAHRSGKTTLARAVAEQSGIHFHETNTSAMLKARGIDPVGVHDLGARIELQWIILHNHLEEIAKLPRPCIVDRTPADMYAYMAGEITMHNSTVTFGAGLEHYRVQCLRAMAMHYDTVMVVKPLASYEVDPTKPPCNVGYQWMIQHLIEGFLMDENVDHLARATLMTDDFTSRMKHSISILTQRFDQIAELRKTLTIN